MEITAKIQEIKTIRRYSGNGRTGNGLDLLLENGVKIIFGYWHHQILDDWILPCLLVGDSIKLALVPEVIRGRYRAYPVFHLRDGKELSQLGWFETGSEHLPQNDEISISGVENIVTLLAPRMS